MFNVMLDEFPTEWKGYELNTDYRIGIQISQVVKDDSLTKYEKVRTLTYLMFKDKAPDDIAERLDCVTWFLNGWCYDNHKGGSHEDVMDFDIDAGRIYSAFMAQYHIDLNVEDMHHWKFMNLLTNLEECAFTRVIDIRTKKVDGKMTKEERERYMKGKSIYSLKFEIQSEEDKQKEIDAVNEFNKYLQGVK